MIEAFTVAELSRRCGEETARYLRRESYAERFCLELFRRAILQRDDAAWAAVYEQYATIVRRWLRTKTDDEDEGVTIAFERFWRAVDATKFARFGSLSAVLQYLKMCAVTAQMDRVRAARSTGAEESLDESTHDLPGGDNVEEAVAGAVDATRFWQMVQDLLADERERLVVYLSYVIGLSPRAICAAHGAEFPDVTEVYRLKRTVLDRLRRAPQLKDVLS
jgi:DNA-directed RNA polymerase specialized sigma24 family protein